MDNSEAKDERRLKRNQMRNSCINDEIGTDNLDDQERSKERSMNIIAGIHVFKKGCPMKKSVVAVETRKRRKDGRAKRDQK
jgi:hypothetical protein